MFPVLQEIEIIEKEPHPIQIVAIDSDAERLDRYQPIINPNVILPQRPESIFRFKRHSV